MDLIRKKKEELEVLLGTVSGKERNNAADLIKELLNSCSTDKEREETQDHRAAPSTDDKSKQPQNHFPNAGRRSRRLSQKSPKVIKDVSIVKNSPKKKPEKLEEVESPMKRVKLEVPVLDETEDIEEESNEDLPTEFHEESLINAQSAEVNDKIVIVENKEDSDIDWSDALDDEANRKSKKKSKKQKTNRRVPAGTLFGVPKQVTNTRALTMFNRCFLCHDKDTKYSSCDEFKIHLITDHVEMNRQGRPVIKCPRCLEKYYLIRPPDKSLIMRNVIDILTHYVRVHHSNMIDFASTYECPRCDFHSAEKSDWIEHLQVHITEKVKCEQCGKAVAQSSLLTHMKNLHNEDTLRKFPCEYCGKFFASSAQVKYHVERVHFKTKNFKCIICDADFYYKFDLERHMFVWHKQQSENHPIDTCTICGFQTLRGNLMNKHMVNHDAGEYECPHCPKVFQTKNRLRSHVAIHNSSTLWKCANCDYETKKKNHLDRHMTFTHGGVLFQCDLCSFKGTTERGILSHYSRTHGEAGVNLSCFKKIQLSAKPNYTSRKRRCRPTEQVKNTEDKDAMTVSLIPKDADGASPQDLMMKKENEMNTDENAAVNAELPVAELPAVEEVTCVMTGETNEDGTPVILSVQGSEGMSATVADIRYVQHMLQINPEALKEAGGMHESEEGVTVYHIVHTQDLPTTKTE